MSKHCHRNVSNRAYGLVGPVLAERLHVRSPLVDNGLYMVHRLAHSSPGTAQKLAYKSVWNMSDTF